MAWTLLSAGLKPQPVAAAPAREAAGAAEPEQLPADHPPVSSNHEVAHGGDAGERSEAWIISGGLVRTIEQVGMVELLLEGGSAPSTIYGWGIGAAAAVLAAGGDASTLRRGWESLRAARFVTAALVSRRRWIAAIAPTRRIGDALHVHLRNVRSETTLLLRVEGRFLTVADGTLASVLDSATHADSRDPAILAAAVTDAAKRGCERIIVLARHEREAAHDQVAAAVIDARSAGREVWFLPSVGEPKAPSALELVLPGCGRVERLIVGGRRACARWREARARAGGE